MGLDPNLILYACVAKETIVLAEFNSKDHPDLGLLALRCLAKTPSFHTNFTHTIRGKRYTFLIQEPFTYFVISDDELENLEGLGFLESVKEAFGDVGNSCLTIRKLDKLDSHCFQGEFNPVFHQLLSVSREMEGPHSRRKGMKSVHERNVSLDSLRGANKNGMVPLLGGHEGVSLKKKRKKRQFLNDLFWIGKGKDGGGERKVDVCDDDDDDDDDDSTLDYSGSSMDKTNRGISINQIDPLSHAKKSWKKHVWIVLSLDLIICLILFSVWLWVCRGFKCIDG